MTLLTLFVSRRTQGFTHLLSVSDGTVMSSGGRGTLFLRQHSTEHQRVGASGADPKIHGDTL